MRVNPPWEVPVDGAGKYVTQRTDLPINLRTEAPKERCLWNCGCGGDLRQMDKHRGALVSAADRLTNGKTAQRGR